MAKKEKKEKKEKIFGQEKSRSRALGITPILWLCFLLFAILIIVILTLVQVIQYRSRNRERLIENLSLACTDVKSEFSDSQHYPQFDSNAGWAVAYYGNKYSVTCYLIAQVPNGSVLIYPGNPEGETDRFREAFLQMRAHFVALEQETGEDPWEMSGEEELASRLSFSDIDYAAQGCVVKIGEDKLFLYTYTSFEYLNNTVHDMLMNAVYSGLFAIALCFVMSGLISMLVSRPVASVTKRARTLAHGEYNINCKVRYIIREVNDLSNALNYAATELSKTDKIQKDLIANVSHDFRTPLTMIKAYAAMIQEISGEDPEKRLKHTQIIIDEADRLAALVSDLLDLSRLQAGVYHFENSVFNLSEDLYGVTNRFGFMETRGYVIKTDIDDDLYAYGNKARLEQVLYNLIGNAVNYTGDDKTVVIRLKKREGCSRFEVIDSGKGIAPEEIATIWERYYRSSETHKRPVEGTGLGLSIVKNVLKMHGFEFGVESEQGKGSCFWVEFPDPPKEDVEDTASE